MGLDSQVQVIDGVADGEAGIVLGAGFAELLLAAAGDDVLALERGRGAGVSVDVPAPSTRGRAPGQRARHDRRHPACAYESALARAQYCRAAGAVGGAADCVDSAVPCQGDSTGRTIATFRAVKHHCANMLVAAESAIAAVWDAARGSRG